MQQLEKMVRVYERHKANQDQGDNFKELEEVITESTHEISIEYGRQKGKAADHIRWDHISVMYIAGRKKAENDVEETRRLSQLASGRTKGKRRW